MKLSINKVSLVWVVLTILVAIVRLFIGEEQIILHWNITGQADDYGSKYFHFAVTFYFSVDFSYAIFFIVRTHIK